MPGSGSHSSVDFPLLPHFHLVNSVRFSCFFTTFTKTCIIYVLRSQFSTPPPFLHPFLHWLEDIRNTMSIKIGNILQYIARTDSLKSKKRDKILKKVEKREEGRRKEGKGTQEQCASESRKVYFTCQE